MFDCLVSLDREKKKKKKEKKKKNAICCQLASQLRVCVCVFTLIAFREAMKATGVH